MVCGNDVMFERELPYWVVSEKPNTAPDCRLLLLMTGYIWERTRRFLLLMTWYIKEVTRGLLVLMTSYTRE